MLGAADVVVHGSWTVVADFSRFLADNPTAAPPDDDFEPDGALYSMLKAGRRLFVLEANHGEIDKVDPASGRIRGSWTSRPAGPTSPRPPWPGGPASAPPTPGRRPRGRR